MATQTVEFVGPTAQTITAKIFAKGSDTVVASAASTEATNRKGVYTVAFTDETAGTYRLIGFNASGLPLCHWWVTLTLTTATFQAYEVPDGGGVTVLPATGIVADRTAGVTLVPVVGETISQAITVYESDGTTAVDLSGQTLAIVFETMSYTDVATVADANITVSGASNNVVTFAYPAAVTASERTLRFALRDAAAPLTMYLQGVCSVTKAPQVDAA